MDRRRRGAAGAAREGSRPHRCISRNCYRDRKLRGTREHSAGLIRVETGTWCNDFRRKTGRLRPSLRCSGCLFVVRIRKETVSFANHLPAAGSSRVELRNHLAANGGAGRGVEEWLPDGLGKLPRVVTDVLTIVKIFFRCSANQ